MDPNQVFFETVGGFQKGEVLGFGKEGSSLYYERTSRRRHVGSSFSPSVSAQLQKMVERLEESERARAERKRAGGERKEAGGVPPRPGEGADGRLREEIRRSIFHSPRPPDDPTDGSGAYGAFVV